MSTFKKTGDKTINPGSLNSHDRSSAGLTSLPQEKYYPVSIFRYEVKPSPSQIVNWGKAMTKKCQGNGEVGGNFSVVFITD
jgi:hypothetical protein